MLGRLDASQHSTPPLGEILLSIAGGATPLRGDASLYAESGVKFLRILNVVDGEIIESDLKYITETVHNGELGRSQLAAGDVLMTITGRVGSAAVVQARHLPANINQHLVRLRIDTKRCLSSYLIEWLNCPMGLEISNRSVSGGTRVALDYGAIREIRLPLPTSLSVQKGFVDVMAKARAERQAKFAEADALLAGLDDYVLDTLGLTLTPKDERKIFAIRRSTVPTRFDPHFHLPAFSQVLRMLAANGSEPLGNLGKFSRETWKPEQHESNTFCYIEISSVNRDTGEASAVETRVAEAPSRARMAVVAGDIIVSLTRPHHGSIAQITPELDGCVASTGFAVLRDVNEARVMRDYLWCILRTKMCLAQMLQRASGGNYPAITEPELAKVLIPVPDKDIQKTIATEAHRRREEARRLRAEGEAGWEKAKHWFEEQLLGPAQP